MFIRSSLHVILAPINSFRQLILSSRVLGRSHRRTNAICSCDVNIDRSSRKIGLAICQCGLDPTSIMFISTVIPDGEFEKMISVCGACTILFFTDDWTDTQVRPSVNSIAFVSPV
jgi:hypothetical protein